MLRGPTCVQQVLRIVGMRRVFHRVEVIEVAEEFVEAVHGRQELVLVAEVVLAELAGGVAHALERGRDRHGLRRNADRRAGLADRGHAGADRQLAGDEVGAARRAARLGVVVGEQHALGGELVEVRRPPGHHAAVVGADVPHADVVAHDDDDVRPLRRLAPSLPAAALAPASPAPPRRSAPMRPAAMCRSSSRSRRLSPAPLGAFPSFEASTRISSSCHNVLAFGWFLVMHLKPTWLVDVSTGSAWRAAGR